MSDLMENASVDYDGSGSPATADGPIMATFSGTTNPAHKNKPVLKVYSRSDNADYPPPLVFDHFGRHRINLIAGDEWYMTVDGVKAGDLIDLSVVDA